MNLKFIDINGNEEWVNPECVAVMEIGKTKKAGEQITILHTTAPSKPKVFLKETPEELNKIFRKYSSKEYSIIEKK